jgi:hypothetical protein
MLETLVSSKIRRALLEHILIRPTDRFYLRGLAKELNLSVSPLRRELKRLEQSGVLTAAQEGNMLFYTVNTGSPNFLQLQQAVSQTPVSRPAEAPSVTSSQPISDIPPVRTERQISEIGRGQQLWSGPLSSPALIGAAGVGMALMLIIAGLFYLTMTHERLVTEAARALASRKPEVAVMVPASATSSSNSNVMRGSRWQIVPGGFGGFSAGSGSSQESY